MNAYILTIDQEKAFDRVDGSHEKNVGYKMLTKQSSTQVNSYEPTKFPLTRGVRHGCSTSATLLNVSGDPRRRNTKG